MGISAAVAAISYVAADVGVSAAIGSAVLGAVGVADVAIAGTTVGALIGGAVVGTGLGAIRAEATGQNVGKGALLGGVGGLASGVVAGEIGSALSGPAGEAIGPMQPNLAGSSALAAAAMKGGGAFAGGLASGLAGGQPLGQTLKGATIGGVTGGLGAGLGSEFNLGNLGTSALTAGLGYAANQALGTSAKSGSYTPSMSQSAGPSTSAKNAILGQGLNVGGVSGYTPGAGIYGSGESEKPASSVWNKESLRSVGEA